MTDALKSTNATQEEILNTHGWEPDPEDSRDLAASHPAEFKIKVPFVKAALSAEAALPAKVDLSEWFPPVINQGDLPICTAAAVIALGSYLIKRNSNQEREESVLFNYRVSRRLSGDPDRSGSFLRYALSGWALCGSLDEKYWPFDTKQLDVDPNAFCYSVAQNYRAITYLRIDNKKSPEDYLKAIKASLAQGLPVTLGLSLYAPSLLSSLQPGPTKGVIPVPENTDTKLGGHAVLVVGYDDDKIIPPPNIPNVTSSDQPQPPGGLLIRNSWGKDWGQDGYGWLPYSWVLRGLINDTWTVVKVDWVDLTTFRPWVR